MDNNDGVGYALYEALTVSLTSIDVEVETKRYSLVLGKLTWPKIGAAHVCDTDSTLSQYFNFRESLFFFEIDLEELDLEDTSSFRVFFRMKKTIEAYQRVNKDSIKLHCVPVINLFEKDCEPIKITGKHTHYCVNIQLNNKDRLSLHDLKTVESDLKGDKKVQLKRFSSYQEGVKNVGYYRLLRKNRAYLEDRLMLSGVSSTTEQILSISALVSNGRYAKESLKNHYLELEKKDLKQMYRVTCIIEPTTYVESINDDHYYWELVSTLCLNYQLISDLDALKRRIYHLHRTTLEKHKIEAIQSLQFENTSKLSKGIWVQVLIVNVQINDDAFYARGDALLFSHALHNFLLQFEKGDCVLESKFVLVKSGKAYKWPDPKKLD